MNAHERMQPDSQDPCFDRGGIFWRHVHVGGPRLVVTSCVSNLSYNVVNNSDNKIKSLKYPHRSSWDSALRHENTCNQFRSLSLRDMRASVYVCNDDASQLLVVYLND